MTATLVPASLSDVPCLALMNQRLIQDEGSRNPMTLSHLEDRMRGWLEGDWKADLVMTEGKVVGYLLYCYRTDEYFPNLPEVYLRHGPSVSR